MGELLSPRALLESTLHLTISTADREGTPWVSPVAFVVDDDGSLYWSSSRTARHSVNIRARAEAAVVVWDAPPAQAVYMEGKAFELGPDDDLAHAIEVLARSPQPKRYRIAGVDDVSGDAAWRIYRFVPAVAWSRADDTEHGQAVSSRATIPLDELRAES